MSQLRSNRGYAAAWRSVWTWPLRTTNRALATALVAAAAGGLLSTALAESPTPPPAPTPAPAPLRATPPRAAEPAADVPATEISPTGPPVDPAAASTAVATTSRWLHHPAGISNSDWRGQFAPQITPEFDTQLATVDPGNVPGTRVAGRPSVVTSTPTVAVLDVPTDDTTLHVTAVSLVPGEWRVAAIEPAGG